MLTKLYPLSRLSSACAGPNKTEDIDVKTEPKNLGSENTDPRASAEGRLLPPKSRIPGAKDRQHGEGDSNRGGDTNRFRKRQKA